MHELDGGSFGPEIGGELTKSTETPSRTQPRPNGLCHWSMNLRRLVFFRFLCTVSQVQQVQLQFHRNASNNCSSSISSNCIQFWSIFKLFWIQSNFCNSSNLIFFVHELGLKVQAEFRMHAAYKKRYITDEIKRCI